MRKGFDGLSGLVRDGLQKDPLSGDVFIFFNRRRNQVKLLLWERDGFSIYHKRLERGTYELPDLTPSSTSAELRSDELMLILQGISLKSVHRRKRFSMDEKKSLHSALV
jgi:transposase